MAHDVFISYSSKDKATADAVCHSLEAAGIRCWIAPRDVAPGASWPKAISDAIGASRVLVLVFSASADQSEAVQDEVMLALRKGGVVIPLRIEDVAPTGAMEFCLARRHWLDAFTPPLEEHLERLAQHVASLLPVGPPASAPPAPPPVG